MAPLTGADKAAGAPRVTDPAALSLEAFRKLFDLRICDLRTDQFLRDTTLTDALAPLLRSNFEYETESLRRRLTNEQHERGVPRPDRMRVVLANWGLAYYAGSELWTSDVAKFLNRSGVPVVAYAPLLGPVAEQLQAACVRVTSSIREVVEFAPNLLHVNHFRAVAPLIQHLRGQAIVVNMIHGLLPRPGLPGYEGVDRYCCVSIHSKIKTHVLTGTPWDAIEMLPNFFDEHRFSPGARSKKSGKALLFSSRTLPEQRARLGQALAPYGFTLDHVGYGAQPTTAPEHLLPRYDLVFAVGRSAIEALASGCRVVLWDFGIIGPSVTSTNFWQCVTANFDLAANALPWRFIDDPAAWAFLAEQIEAPGASTEATTEMTRRYLPLAAAGNRLLSMYDRALAHASE